MEQIKQGYKQTDIGVIPEDWEVITISEISRPVRGGSPRPAGSPRYFNGNFIPWLTVASMTNVPASQNIITNTASFLTEEGSYLSRTLEKDTLIIANSGATLGVAKILGIKCCANDGIAALLDIQVGFDKLYLLYHINNITDTLRKSIATGNGQPNLNTQLIGNLKFPFPKKTTEQTAIATALSDTDALIAALDKKIAKKQQIKQGAMQQLLTGKKRLPEFRGEWVEIQLGECFTKIIGGGTPSRTNAEYWNGNILWATVKDFATFNPCKTQEYITHLGLMNSSSHLIPKHTPITSTRMGLGKIVVYDVDVAINQDLKALFISGEFDQNYIVHWFTFSSEIIEALGTGSTVKGIRLEQLKAIPIYLPNDKNEQNCIAQILTDMDNEIAQLEKERDKYKEIKAGMMQVLLTGKVRLV